MFGGRVYAAPLREIYEDFDNSAPIHRWVRKEKISLVAGDEMFSLEYEEAESTSFTTYLTDLAGWMAKNAEGAGALVITEVRVDKLIVEDGWVKGIIAGNDKVYSDVVIDAEGVNRLILERSGIVPKLKPEHVALGVKEVIKLSQEDVNKLFGLDDDSGLAWVLMGDVTNGVPGGAFIYTNRDSVSIGLVVLLSEAMRNIEEHISRYVENLRLHPLLNKYFKEGRIMEYSAHLIPENVNALRPRKLVYNGLMIAGDAAGLLLNLGYTYRGVDFASYSGYLAAKAFKEAHEDSDYSERSLSRYVSMLRESFIMKNLDKFRDVHNLMLNKRLFTTYPLVANETAHRLFNVEYDSPKLSQAVKESMRGRIGLLSALLDLYRIYRRL
jgi:electron transfer flavoprotein-quinone oxidoreductase